jgi:hypothetical protein
VEKCNKSKQESFGLIRSTAQDENHFISSARENGCIHFISMVDASSLDNKINSNNVGIASMFSHASRRSLDSSTALIFCQLHCVFGENQPPR